MLNSKPDIMPPCRAGFAYAGVDRRGSAMSGHRYINDLF
jgi:hypothetical protein